MIESVQLWLDGEERTGPENMAVDEWLLGSAEAPVLRVYRWQPGWGSYGYFVARADAERALPGLRLVRRWTGGGIVDHCRDWTYTLVVPRGWDLAERRGAGSYAVVHRALGACLASEGIPARLAGRAAPARAGECFRQAVEHDLVGAAGEKLAGAGQRRSARGLLHQGSVACPGDMERGRRLAGKLALHVRPFPGDVPELREILARRYAPDDWNGRR